VGAGRDRPSPSWRGGLQVAVQWWILMTGMHVGLVKCAVGRGKGVGTLHNGGRCEAIVLFLFLAVYYYII
jgi:hypothetical protein